MTDASKHRYAKTHYGIYRAGGVAVRFVDQSKPFFHGFEAGRIWDLLLEPQDADTTLELEIDVSPENMELVTAMAVELGFEPVVVEAGDAQRYGRMKLTRYAEPESSVDPDAYTTH